MKKIFLVSIILVLILLLFFVPIKRVIVPGCSSFGIQDKIKTLTTFQVLYRALLNINVDSSNYDPGASVCV